MPVCIGSCLVCTGCSAGLSGATYPLFTRAGQSGFEPCFESGSTGVRPGYVHTGGKVVVVKNCIPEVFI